MDNLESLLPYFENKKIILIGENHGVVENATFVSHVISLLSDNTINIDFVGFEYPFDQYETFMQFVTTDDFEGLIKTKWGAILSNDGRLSKDHFQLMKKLQSEGIEIVFFDDGEKSWDARDKEMYENSKNHLAQLSSKALLITGNIHSKFSNLNLNGKPYIPFATYLNKKDICNIELKYHSGEFFNHTRRKFEEVKMPDNLIEKVDETTVYFHVARATPTK